MKRFFVIQTLRPYQGSENVLEDCFRMIDDGDFQTLQQANDFIIATGHPERFIIIKGWLPTTYTK